MQKRARTVAGTLQIVSTPGQGTQVRVKASLQKVSLRKRILAIMKERFGDLPKNAGKR
jgi:hypothetical protein